MPVGRGAALALAACTAALYLAAFRVPSAWPLALVAYAPLAIAIRDRRPLAAGALGLVSGTLICTAGFSWLAGPIAAFGELPAFAAALAVVAVGLASGARFALHAFGAALASRRGAPFSIAFLASFAAAEACVPALVPWSLTGAVAHVPVLVQSAELWGEVPIAAALILPGVVLADAVGAWRRRDEPGLAGAAWCAAIAVALVAYGAVRMERVDRYVAASPPVRVGVVQPAVPLAGDDADDERALLRELTLHEDLARRGAELVVWPEGAVPRALEARTVDRTLALLDLGVPAIVGATIIERDGLPRNAVLAVEEGRLVGRYDKQRLLLFSETLPLATTFPFLRSWSPASGQFVPGERAAPLVLAGHAIAAVVCCEDVVADQVRAASDARAELLVSLSNDAWFVDPEPRLHLALARLRAIEQRKFFVRATNDGVSAVIDPNGRVVAAAPTRRAATLLADVRWLAGRTPFDRIGGAIPWLSAAVFAALLLLPRRRERGSRRDAAIRPSRPGPRESH